jgi:CDP-diacylglycerol---glycerol-3-phosphate 3-phosphatidyltransferase
MGARSILHPRELRENKTPVGGGSGRYLIATPRYFLGRDSMLKLTYIPWLLVGLRFTIAPLLLLIALNGSPGIGFLLGYIIAFLSDIFDGIIARKLNVSTVKLRQADSWADMSLYLCIAVSAWLVYPAVIIAFRIPLMVAIAFQLLLFTISLIKFGKFPSFHTYTAKAWGISLFVAVVGLFGYGWAGALWGAIGLCIVNSVEEIIMTLILPEWKHDVLSIVHALRLRDR